MRTLLPIPSLEEAEFVFDPHGVAEELVRYIDLVARGPSGAGVIIGNYGFGKTHLMLYLINATRKKFPNTLAIYVNSPGQSILNIYRAFMLAILSKELIKGMSDGLDQPFNDLLSLIAKGDDEAKYAKQWLLGDPVPQGFRTKYGLPSSRITEELAIKLMIDILNLLVRQDIAPILIMLDELEDILTIGPTKRLQYLNQLRLFIDSLSSKTLFLTSSTPAGWDGVVNIYPALARRLSSFTVYLRPLNVDETGKFIAELIKWRGIKLNLNDEAVKVIHEFTEGNPGEIVKVLHLILLELNEKKLDADKVKELLSRHV